MNNFKKQLKYAASGITFAEYPNEVALYIEISGCPIHCPECHSKFLWENTGVTLTNDIIKHIIRDSDGITAVVIGGGDQDEDDVLRIARYIKFYFPTLKICWYSGKAELTNFMKEHISHEKLFNAIKIGPYDSKCGPLDSKTTNQRFYEIDYNSNKGMEMIDKTHLFWKKEM